MRDAVILGAGQAAAVAARTLRRRGYDGRLTLVGDETHPPYQRPPLSKEYVQGTEERENLFLLTEKWCADKQVELRLGVRAVRVVAHERSVDLADGSRLRADAVLIATGGRPRRLRGVEGRRVHYLRSVEDADAIRELLAPGRHVIVVGAGFIGSEIAASARVRGARVTVVEMLDVPLRRVLGRRMGEVCADIHRRGGVDLRTGVGVESVDDSGTGVVVRTTDGAAVEGDAVVVGVGIVPNTEVADDSGIKVENGVWVDEYCRTSQQAVFAAGDVANHYHPLYERRMRVEHFDNANKQGAAAAKNMLGRSTVFDDPHWFWSDQYDLNLQHAGDPEHWTDLVVRGSVEDLDFTAFYLDDGVVRAVFAVERGGEVAVGKELIAAGVAPDPAKLAADDVDLADLLPAT